jgi:hypothetical protein
MTEEGIDLRKVQGLQGERSLTIVLPKEFAFKLGIGKGDWLKVTMADAKLIIQKAEI